MEKVRKEMRIVQNFYCGDHVKKHRLPGYIRKLNKRKVLSGILLLIVRENSRNLMEIVSSRELYRMIDREQGIMLIGIAASREDAFELVERIMGEITAKYAQAGLEDLKMALNEEFRIYA